MAETTEISDESVITFPEGLPGFENAKRFVILKPEDLEPILLLLTVEGESLRLPVIPVQFVRSDYQLKVEAEDRRLLGLTSEPVVGQNVLCLSVLVMPGNDRPPTCNLMAPIVINPDKRIAKQILQLESDHPSALPLLPE